MKVSHALLVAALGAGCTGSATARLALSNDTAVARSSNLLADGTSLRLRIIAVYLAEDVDPATQNNVGSTEMVWLSPECAGDISGCNVSGFASPEGGPRVTSYFDLARPTAEVNAELNSQGAAVAVGDYRYARIEMCKSYNGEQPTEPTLMWAGPGMTAEQPFTSGDCGRTSLAFDPPLTLAETDSVEVTLGYDLGKAIAAGAPNPIQQGCSMTIEGINDPGGGPHCFRTCTDIDADHRACMDFPDFAPSASVVAP